MIISINNPIKGIVNFCFKELVMSNIYPGYYSITLLLLK